MGYHNILICLPEKYKERKDKVSPIDVYGWGTEKKFLKNWSLGLHPVEHLWVRDVKRWVEDRRPKADSVTSESMRDRRPESVQSGRSVTESMRDRRSETRV